MAEGWRNLTDGVGDRWRRIAHMWRTSLQMRVVTSVMMVSVLVVGILGFALVSIVAQRLMDAKFTVANEEIDRARGVVEQQIAASGADGLQARLNVGREALSDRQTTTEAGAAAAYEAVLVAPGPNGEPVMSPSDGQIPGQLRPFVQQGMVSSQYDTLEARDGSTYSALVIGTPTASEVPGLELYLVFPMTGEESTLALVRGLFAGATVVMTLLLVGITWFFANQVTAPVRSASRIAERFAAGHLRERMAVEGEDEMARLAVSFNKMAESLSLQIRQLEEYGDLQRQFTSDVSHELRTPLTTVRMAADLIYYDAESLEPHTRRAAELMIAELDRFEMLLADLLEISRHDAGVADLSAERVDVRQCVDAAFQPLVVVAQEAGTEVRLDMPDSPVFASVDSRRVERILRNLVANAIDHSEGNPVVVAVRADDAVVAFTVTDQGVGLKPEQEDLVFNRFWRADPSRERRTGGTGLGLAIAREDALLHGGELEAHGVPGVGSCFRLMLPVRPGGTLSSAPLRLEVPGAPAEARRREEAIAARPSLADGAGSAPALRGVVKREAPPAADAETDAGVDPDSGPDADSSAGDGRGEAAAMAGAAGAAGIAGAAGTGLEAGSETGSGAGTESDSATGPMADSVADPVDRDDVGQPVPSDGLVGEPVAEAVGGPPVDPVAESGDGIVDEPVAEPIGDGDRTDFVDEPTASDSIAGHDDVTALLAEGITEEELAALDDEGFDDIADMAALVGHASAYAPDPDEAAEADAAAAEEVPAATDADPADPEDHPEDHPEDDPEDHPESDADAEEDPR